MKLTKKHKEIAKIIAVVIIIISLSIFIYYITTIIINKKTSEDVSDDNETDGMGVPLIDKRQYDSDKKSTILIQNKTSEEYLHVFITSLITDESGPDSKPPEYKMKQIWRMVKGNGKVNTPINWNRLNSKGQGISFNPLGAQVATEVIIPKGGYVLLDNPIKQGFKGVNGNIISQFKILPIKFDRTNTTMKPEDFLEDPINDPNWGDMTYIKNKTGLLKQNAILIEAGEKAVADASAVDGLNYRIKYSLTTKNGIQKTSLNTNPCEGLDDNYKIDPEEPNPDFNKLEVGCYNPYKIDCLFNNKSNDTADCTPNTQDCCFNECSQTLFNIPPSNLNRYKCPNKDGGKGPDGKNTPIVKTFINNENNLKNNALKEYCNNMHSESNLRNSDFEIYCYDYNDVNASPVLSSPYLIDLIIYDLEN